MKLQRSIHRKSRFMRAACALSALTIGAASEATEITYETRTLTGTDGPLGPGLGAGVVFRDFGGPVIRPPSLPVPRPANDTTREKQIPFRNPPPHFKVPTHFIP